jgi:hypothetical protein
MRRWCLLVRKYGLVGVQMTESVARSRKAAAANRAHFEAFSACEDCESLIHRPSDYGSTRFKIKTKPDPPMLLKTGF